ncbi:flavodoxin family protein [Nocardia bovistercoris]|uniref:Flavodoxin domain-containing protein n=1 Tax=Nocardia bovistercoris TaxID=2785916 RepID=A0A931N3V3_9NOCA|nr:flavodoxin domain-containing protein [Nocardia bovistercoris]MBH0781055.1 flavodoxin domain-containing protein [Nocardia bovistercoris]
MRARIVYESMFGNTRAIAEAIADGLRDRGEVDVLDVVTAAEVPDAPVDLLVVGGPTHAFGLSRPRTRGDAATKTDSPVSVDFGMREWLDGVSMPPRGTRAAAFGTKAATPRWLPGSAARGVGRRLRRSGYELADAPVDFFVGGLEGPLVAGEVERARAWGRRLAQQESARLSPRQ